MMRVDTTRSHPLIKYGFRTLRNGARDQSTVTGTASTCAIDKSALHSSTADLPVEGAPLALRDSPVG